MVDPIGAKAITARDLAVARVAPATAVKAPATTAANADTAVLNSPSIAANATAPVDSDRVARVKKAIADGKFPILPTTIADRLIAYKLEWTQNDQA